MPRVERRISLLVPFQTEDPHRIRNWRWLESYWRAQVPGVEICIGVDRTRLDGRQPFSKTTAINDAFHKSHGDIVVILDADAYLSAEWLQQAAERIRHALARGIRLWFMPYRWLYRLTEPATDRVLASSPEHPYVFPDPVPSGDYDPFPNYQYGHQWGALCMVMPREAFLEVGCADPRFRGWGGEDIAFLQALDTLWGHHRNLPAPIFHLWHPSTPDPAIARGETESKVIKVWDGQDASQANNWLARQYQQATGHPEAMRRLVDAGCKPEPKKRSDPLSTTFKSVVADIATTAVIVEGVLASISPVTPVNLPLKWQEVIAVASAVVVGVGKWAADYTAEAIAARAELKAEGRLR